MEGDGPEITGKSSGVPEDISFSGKNTTEIPDGKERDSRSSVLEAFNNTLTSYHEEIFANSNSDKARPHLLALNLIERIKAQTLDKGKNTHTATYTDRTGRERRLRESVPIRPLLEHLTRKLNNPDLPPTERQKLESYQKILYNNSILRAYSPSDMEARIDYELNLLQKASGISTGSREADNRIVSEVFAFRFDLLLPKKEANKEIQPKDLPIVKNPDRFKPQHNADGSQVKQPEEFPDGAGEIPAHKIAEYLGEEESPPPSPPKEGDAIEITPDDIAATPSEIEITSEEVKTDSATKEPKAEAAEVKTTPTSTSIEDVQREAMIVNRTLDLHQRARERAEEHLRAEQRRGNMLNPLNWARKTRLRVLEEFYRQRYISEALREMIAANNTYLELDLFSQAATNINTARDQQSTSERSKVQELKTGENIAGNRVVEIDVNLDVTLDGNLKDFVFDEIIAPIVDGQITNNDQIQQALREFVQNHQDDAQVAALFGRDATRFGTIAELFASDLLEVGNQLRQDREAHNYSMERLKELTTIKLANANWAADSATQWTLADRAIAWSQRNNKRRWFTNPAVVGAAVSIGIYGGMSAAGMSGRALLAAPVAGSVLGAALAGLRRAHDLKVDRAAHQADREYNASSLESDRRRRQLDNYQYENVSFNTLINGGQERENVFGDSRGMRELMELSLSPDNPTNTDTNQQAILRRAAEIRARLDYGFNNQKGLITYESREAVEQNRMSLVRSIAEARVKLRDSGMDNDMIDARLTEFQGEWNVQFNQDVRDQDRAFNMYRVRSSLVSAGIGGAIGLASGLGAAAAVRGIIEATGKNAYVTGLENIPYADKVFGKTNEARANIAQLLKDRKPVDVGDMTIIPGSENNVSVKLPDGSEKLLPNAKITDTGSLRVEGDIPTDIRDEFDMEGFEIKNLDPIKKEDIIIGPSAPQTTEMLNGRPTLVPEGTNWVPDASDPSKFDLVVTSHPEHVLVDNAQFDESGKMTFESSIATFTQDADTIPGETISTPTEVFGPEGLWSKETTPISGREWYAYDTPYSDHNELRAYNSVFDAGNGQKGVEWDMSDMKLGYQSGIEPNPIDIQQVIRDGQAGFAFTLPDDQKNPIWVSDISDGKLDGKIRLDPTDFTNKVDPSNPNSMTVGEFSRIVLNQEKLASLPEGSLASEVYGHQDVFNLGRNGKMGFIETGRLVDRGDGKVLQAFATANGASPTPTMVDVPVQGPPPLQYLVGLK